MVRKKGSDSKLTIIIVLLIILLVYVLGVLLSEPTKSLMSGAQGVYLFEERPVESGNCENLTLESTAFCLQDIIIADYNYTLIDDRIRSWEDIKVNGGDCFDYNMMYKKWAKKLGFYGYTFTIRASNTTTHMFAIIADHTGYCKLDQTDFPDCFMY